MSKKYYKFLLILSLIISPITPICNHEHNNLCGYNPQTQSGCTHQHDESCNEDEFDLNYCDPEFIRC